MRTRFAASRVVSVLALMLGIGACEGKSGPSVYIHEGVAGPASDTVVPAAKPFPLRDYSEGGPERLAILLTDPESCWPGLVLGLKSIGVPFVITRDYHQALQHHVVLVYPAISGKTVDPDVLSALAEHSQQGGTLIGFGVMGTMADQVFGIGPSTPSQHRKFMTFAVNQALTAEFTDAREHTIPVGTRSDHAVPMWTDGYTQHEGHPVATFDDGSVAISQKIRGAGRAYAFGLDVGLYLLKGYNGRQEEFSRSYANEFEPTLDVLLRLLKTLYRQGEGSAVTLGTVPDGKALSVVLTHDIDYTRSIVNAERYAEYEKARGLRGTYFVQTKYVKDWSDDIFFDAAGVTHLKQLQALGMEIGSHSVSHSRAFKTFPVGSGKERYPDYRPVVKDFVTTVGGTILGELRVSKFLIERFLGQGIRSFRPGHLIQPYELPEAMEATGFRFSSSTTANNAMTHLPFRTMYGRDVHAGTNVFEFPVTIEDEAEPPLLQRLPAALTLAGQLERYGACMVILIHPDVVEPKLDFEKGFVTAMKDRAWFGSLDQLGDWWAARDAVTVDIEPGSSPSLKTLRLTAPKPIHGLMLEIPAKWHYEGNASGIKQDGPHLLIAEAKGDLRIDFKIAR